MQAFVGELAGTACLVMLGNASTARLQGTRGAGALPVAWAAATFVGLTVAAASGIGHLNPAVTLAFWANGAFPAELVQSTILAQSAGAGIGAVLGWIASIPWWLHETDHHARRGVLCAVPPVAAPLWALVVQMAAGAVLALAFLAMREAMLAGSGSPAEAPWSMVWAAGGAVTTLALAVGLGAGFDPAFNPARDLAGRAVFGWMPDARGGLSPWTAAWCSLLGPVAGAMAIAWALRPVDAV